jgi:M6 family metalloprotease-like protein
MRKIVWIAVMMASACMATQAMPFRPGLVDGSGYSRELGRYLDFKKEPGMDEPGAVGKLAPGDTVRAIVILIDFTDAYADTVNHPGWRYQQMLFDGPWPTQTMKEYYHEVSYGDFTVTGEVTTVWYRANNGHDYYGYNNGATRAAALVKEACQKADAAINFNLYDRNGDGYVDALFVIHQGPGREETGSGNDIHSHRWRLDYGTGSNYTTGEGKICRDYSIEPEMHNSTTYSNIYNKIITIGVFAHEYGHVLGLPDLYDTDYSSDGLGNYCLMSGGSWGGNGQSPSRPVQMTAWSKAQKGWVVPENIPANVTGKKLPPVETSRSVYKVWKDGTPGQQYFLVENRRRQGFDALLPNDGLLIYHIDASQSGNTNDNRRLVDLESASADTANKDHLDVPGGSGSNSGDYWLATAGKTSFDPFSDADSRSNTSPYLTMVAAYNMRPGEGDTVVMDFFVGGSHLTAASYHINDATGNNNGIAEDGETVGLTVTLANTSGWSNATGISTTLSTTDTSVTITKAAAVFPNINNGTSASCAADSFAFHVKPGVLPHMVTFVLTKTSSPESYDKSDTLKVPVGFPRILLVDDDAGAGYEIYYRGSLDTANALYRDWQVSSQGSPSQAKLDSFPVVIWFTGDDSLNTLTSEDTTNLKSYLDGGGKLFISSKQLGQQLGATGFYADYLKAQFVNNNANQRFIRGVAGDPIGGSVGDTLAIGFQSCASNYTSLDAIQPLSGADTCFVYRTSGLPGAVKYQGTYKMVYFGFPFEAIGGPHPRYRYRTEIMGRILAWFGGIVPTGVEEAPSDLNTPGRLAISISAAPNPFQSRAVLSFRLEKESRAALSVYNNLGQRVATVFRGRLGGGDHRLAWDGKGDGGRNLSSGVYFVRLEAEGQGVAMVRAVKLR